MRITAEREGYLGEHVTANEDVEAKGDILSVLGYEHQDIRTDAMRTAISEGRTAISEGRAGFVATLRSDTRTSCKKEAQRGGIRHGPFSFRPD